MARTLFLSFMIIKQVSVVLSQQSSSDTNIQHYPPNNSTTFLITNDVPWYDNNGNVMETNRGGKITKIGTEFYWLGILPLTNHILFYKSSTLGSESWVLVRTIHLELPIDPPPEHNTLLSCQLHQHPKSHINYIFCKNGLWFMQEEPNLDPTIGSYKALPIPKDPSMLSQYKFGGESTYQEDDDLYLIVSRCRYRQNSDKVDRNARKLFIYKFNDQWTDFDSEIIRFPWVGREAPWIIKRQNMYYIFVSQTKGWKDSETFYKQSDTMKGFKDAIEKKVFMHPNDTKSIKSMGSQFRFVMEPEYGSDKWIFGGNRYPLEAPDIWDSRYGRHIMVPMNFIDGVPHVYWKRKYDWLTYGYNGDYDEHNHGGNGHRPIKSSDDLLEQDRMKKTKSSDYLLEQEQMKNFDFEQEQ